MSSSITFKCDNKLFTVNKNPDNGLHRLNAMTFYEEVFPSVRCAYEQINFSTGNKLFYLINTKEQDWLQVDIETGENIINILKNPLI
jgi:hypothetical protein